MHKKESRRLLLMLAGMALFIGIFGFAVHTLERVIPEQKTVQSQEAFLADATAEPAVQGTIKLDGVKYEYTDEIASYLLLGIDESGSEKQGQENETSDYQGGMADFLLLAVFNRTQKTYGFLQLDRDTMTSITMLQADGSGYASAEMQLCTAHWYGGDSAASCENTVNAVSDLLGGIEIDGYYALGMSSIPKLNQAVGGVEVTIEDDFSKTDPSLEKGKTLVLSDDQAYTFLHDRYDVDDETNASRMRRQRQYMKSLFQSVQERTKQDAEYMNSVYQSLEEVAVTDISGKNVSKIMKRVSEGDNQGIQTLTGEYRLGQALDDGLDHMEFYPDQDSVVSTLTALYHLTEKKAEK